MSHGNLTFRSGLRGCFVCLVALFASVVRADYVATNMGAVNSVTATGAGGSSTITMTYTAAAGGTLVVSGSVSGYTDNNPASPLIYNTQEVWTTTGVSYDRYSGQTGGHTPIVSGSASSVTFTGITAGTVITFLARVDHVVDGVHETRDFYSVWPAAVTGTPHPWATTLKYMNDKPYPVRLHLLKDGVEVGTYTVAANTLFGHTFEDIADEKPSYSMVGDVDELSKLADGTWVRASVGTAFTFANESINPNKVTETPANTPPTPANTTTVPSATNLPAAMPTSSGAANVWRAPTVTGNNTTDALTNSTFREGIDKVTARQDALKEQQKVENDKNTARETSAKATLEAFGDGTAKNAAALSAANTAGGSGEAAAAAGLVDKFGSAPGSALGASPAAASSDYIEYNIGAPGTRKVYKNPFHPDGPFNGAMGTVAAFVKRLVAWGIVATFFIWVLDKVRTVVSELFRVAPFSKSIEDSLNSIKIGGFGGGIGYLARGAALLLLAPLVLTLPVVILAAVTAGLPWSTLSTTFTAGAGSLSGGIGETALSLVDCVVPWSMLLATPIWYFTVEFLILPKQMFWLMFKKFIPL